MPRIETNTENSVHAFIRKTIVYVRMPQAFITHFYRWSTSPSGTTTQQSPSTQPQNNP